MTAASPSLRIGILSARFPPAYYGGAELQAAELARRLARRHRVVVFTRDGGDPRLVEHWREAGVEVAARSAGAPPLLRSAQDVLSSWSALRARSGALDVVVAYQAYIDGLLGLVARRALRVPLVIWIRGEIEVRPEQSLRTRLLSRRILRGADRVFVQSERLRAMTDALLSGRSDRKRPAITRVLNGLELPAEVDEPRAGLLFVGRLVRRKGLEHLLHALRLLPAASLDVVGSGPDRERLAQLARGLPVTFHGRRSPLEVRGFMRRAAALVLPAVEGEGTPNVVLEAMAHALPVVATDGGGIADVVRHGETGLLVRPGDPVGLAGALRRVLGDVGLRHALGRAARDEVRPHAWDRVVPHVERELAAVVQSAGAGRP